MSIFQVSPSRTSPTISLQLILEAPTPSPKKLWIVTLRVAVSPVTRDDSIVTEEYEPSIVGPIWEELSPMDRARAESIWSAEALSPIAMALM